MATTTNYSWTTPDDTALVKDGAAAIRTLGSSVDTTVKNLNPETTLGDIAYRSSTANVKTRLALGTAGQVLTVNSGATAPEWTTIATGGYTQIATGSLSGATTTISSIPGTYKDLILYVYDYVISSTGGAMFVRMNADSGANYSSTGVVMEGAAGTAVFTNNGGTEEYFTGYGGNTAANNLHSTLIFYNYANTDAHKNYLVNGTSFNTTASPTRFAVKNGMGVYRSINAITSLVIHSGSNTFSAGTYYLYGVK